MKYSVKAGKDDCTIRISGPLDIPHVEQLSQVLMENMEKYAGVYLDLEQLESLGMANIQLFCSANKSFEKKGKTLARKGTGKQTAAVSQAMAGLGYNHSRGGCIGDPCMTCFWKGEY